VAASKRAPRCPPSLEAEAYAVITLAHEQQHVDGVVNEATAECYARQRASRAARQLRLSAPVAAHLAAFITEEFDPPAPRYRSAECRRGGALDLHLPGGWPVDL
jgi:hypothetical protein